jgi:ribosome-binding factor A
MKAWSRADRVGRLVCQILADRLTKGTSDPDIEGVVITGAKMSPDIKVATVFFRIVGVDGEEDPIRVTATAAALERAKYRLHQELRQQMKIKYIPTLRFRYDASLDRIERLEYIFQELEAERDDGA